jgi:hypothetical protein
MDGLLRENTQVVWAAITVATSPKGRIRHWVREGPEDKTGHVPVGVEIRDKEDNEHSSAGRCLGAVPRHVLLPVSMSIDKGFECPNGYGAAFVGG